MPDPLEFEALREDAWTADIGHPDEPFYVRLISRDATCAHERARLLEGKRVRITFEVLE